MTLEELQDLCDKAAGLQFRDTGGVLHNETKFYNSARAALPVLIEIARAATLALRGDVGQDVVELALAKFEALK